MTHYWQTIDGWFAFREAYDRIVAALPSDRPSVVVELGTWVGRSTAYLGVEIVNSRKPVTLVAVDHFKGSAEITGTKRAPFVESSESVFRRNIEPVAEALGDRFAVLVMDSIEASRTVQDGTVDAVFIDGSHAYEPVLRDITAWWPKVRNGGLFGGDDFVKCPGVALAVAERFGALAGVTGTPYWMVRKTIAGEAVPA